VVFPIVNRSPDHLVETWAYLEHLGTSDGRLEPATWQIGDLGPGETFYATWEIEVLGSRPPVVEPCLAVGAAKFDAVRLRGRLIVEGGKEKRMARTVEAVDQRTARQGRLPSSANENG
jgi:hypothetical protein